MLSYHLNIHVPSQFNDVYFVLDVLTFARAQGFPEHQMISLIIIYKPHCMYVLFQFRDVGLVYPFILSDKHEGLENSE